MSSHVTEPLPPPEPVACALEVEVPLDEAEADADADAFAEPLPLALALAEEELVKNWNAIASLPGGYRHLGIKGRPGDGTIGKQFTTCKSCCVKPSV